MFSNTLSFHSSRNVSDQVSNPYKSTGKIIILYILIFTFMDLHLRELMLYALFWAIPRRLCYIFRRFGPLCSIFIPTCL